MISPEIGSPLIADIHIIQIPTKIWCPYTCMDISMDFSKFVALCLKNNTLCPILWNFNEQMLLILFVLVNKSFSNIPLGLIFYENIGKTCCEGQKKVVYTPLQTTINSQESEPVH